MGEKHIDFDIDDPRAAFIAEVMTNKTCKRIINLLAEKEISESDIAQELGIPLNTVGYNIDKLLKAGLIEKSKNFFWSVKGKKIPTYKLSNKKIVISPKRLVSNVPLMIFGAIIIALVILGIMFSVPGGKGPLNGINSNNNFKQFNSLSELKEFLANSSNSNRVYGQGMLTSTTGVNAAIADNSLAGAAPTAEASGKGAQDYSNTNVQVQGVDEPDIVKNDGKYIYTVSQNRVFIANAYPADQMKIVSELDFNGSNVGNIFVNGDKLIVFSQGYSSPILYANSDTKMAASVGGIGKGGGVANAVVSDMAPVGGMPIRNNDPKTDVYIYDISDRQNPVLDQNISVDGSYVDARMINNFVYLISNKYVYGDNVVLPMYRINGVEANMDVKSIYYPPYQDNNYAFTIISAINIDNNDFNSKVYLLDGSTTTYVSQNNIYLSYTKSIDYNDYQDRMIKEAIIPLLPADLQDEVNGILNSNNDYYNKDNQVQVVVENYSMGLTGKDKEDFDGKLQNSLEEFQVKMAKEYEKTVIHKISIDKENIDYKGNGEVPGTLLNQFSLDEYNDNLRVATTIQGSGSINSSNNLYVLDSNLKIKGQIENLAEGERIYSTRFLGNRAYMVTFKNVDPLFVIDLSQDTPKVLGYLKVPGYSDYLHPYDENHIIGIGRDVNESIDADKVHSPGSVYYTAVGGIKISLFDVSDFENPVESANYIIGSRDTSSPVSFDYKAFLFDKDKNLLVIPVNQWDYNGGNSWQGVYVFNITESSIDLKGKITHMQNSSNYDYGLEIQRSLFMDNTLYTVSLREIKANDLSNLNEINRLEMLFTVASPIYYAM